MAQRIESSVSRRTDIALNSNESRRTKTVLDSVWDSPSSGVYNKGGVIVQDLASTVDRNIIFPDGTSLVIQYGKPEQEVFEY